MIYRYSVNHKAQTPYSDNHTRTANYEKNRFYWGGGKQTPNSKTFLLSKVISFLILMFIPFSLCSRDFLPPAYCSQLHLIFHTCSDSLTLQNPTLIPRLINFTACNWNHITRENLVWNLVVNHFHLYPLKYDTNEPIFPSQWPAPAYLSSPSLNNFCPKTSQMKLIPMKFLSTKRNKAISSIFSLRAFSLGQRTYSIELGLISTDLFYWCWVRMSWVHQCHLTSSPP